MVMANGHAKSEADLAREQPATRPFASSFSDVDALTVDEAKARLREIRTKTRLTEAEAHYAQTRRGKSIREASEFFDYMSTFGDLIDRLRSPDGILLTPISTANDRLYGANWPFWRTWTDHARLRGVSRIIYGTNQQAQGALRGLRVYVLGKSGTEVQVQRKKNMDPPKELLDECQRIIDECWERNEMAELEKELFTREHRDGEYFERYFKMQDGYLEIRTVEPEFVVESIIMDRKGSYGLEEYSFGCHTAKGDLQKRLGFWVSYTGSSVSGDYVPIDQMQFVKLGTDRQIKRGMPDFVFDTYDGLKSASRTIQAMCDQAGIQASIAFIRQHKTALPSQLKSFQDQQADFQRPDPFTGSQTNVQRVKSGTVWDVGEGFEYVDRSDWGSSIQYWSQAAQMSLRNVAVKWCAPEWLISGDASSNSYANAVEAGSPFIKSCEDLQEGHSRARVKTAWKCLKTWAEGRGGIEANGVKYPYDQVRRIVTIQAELPSVEVRKKLEEAQTDQVYFGMGIKSAQQITREQGGDYEETQQEIEDHNERTGGMAMQLGLPAEGEQTGAVVKAPKPPEPAGVTQQSKVAQ